MHVIGERSHYQYCTGLFFCMRKQCKQCSVLLSSYSVWVFLIFHTIKVQFMCQDVSECFLNLLLQPGELPSRLTAAPEAALTDKC